MNKLKFLSYLILAINDVLSEQHQLQNQTQSSSEKNIINHFNKLLDMLILTSNDWKLIDKIIKLLKIDILSQAYNNRTAEWLLNNIAQSIKNKILTIAKEFEDPLTNELIEINNLFNPVNCIYTLVNIIAETLEKFKNDNLTNLDTLSTGSAIKIREKYINDKLNLKILDKEKS